MQSRRRWTTGLGALAATIGLAGLAPKAGAESTSNAPAFCHLPQFGPDPNYHPTINPTNFSADVTNHLFPLTVGRTLVYTGTKDHKEALHLFAASSRTMVIDGVTTRVVADRLSLNGIIEERTSDYYAQDKRGNVWYFGEDTATLDRYGNVTSREGSFHAGIHGAQPGVFMQIKPQLKRRFRHQWYAGHAEDTYQTIDLSTPVTVPYGTFRHALRTAVGSRLVASWQGAGQLGVHVVGSWKDRIAMPRRHVSKALVA